MNLIIHYLTLAKLEKTKNYVFKFENDTKHQFILTVFCPGRLRSAVRRDYNLKISSA